MRAPTRRTQPLRKGIALRTQALTAAQRGRTGAGFNPQDAKRLAERMAGAKPAQRKLLSRIAGPGLSAAQIHRNNAHLRYGRRRSILPSDRARRA